MVFILFSYFNTRIWYQCVQILMRFSVIHNLLDSIFIYYSSNIKYQGKCVFGFLLSFTSNLKIWHVPQYYIFIFKAFKPNQCIIFKNCRIASWNLVFIKWNNELCKKNWYQAIKRWNGKYLHRWCLGHDNTLAVVLRFS